VSVGCVTDEAIAETSLRGIVSRIHMKLGQAINFSSHLIQSYSHGPLLITRDMFEALCERIGAFPRIKDTALYMGGRRCEVEVAPPRVQFNACPKTVEGFSSTGYGRTSEFLADPADTSRRNCILLALH